MNWEQPVEEPVAKPKLLERIVVEALEPLPDPYRWHLGRHVTDSVSKDRTGAYKDEQLVLSIIRPGLLGWFTSSQFASDWVFDEAKTEAGLLQWLAPEHREGALAAIRGHAKNLRARLDAHLGLGKVLESTEEDRR